MKIAIVRSETVLTFDQQEQARQRVAKQLPSDWTVIFLPSLTSAEFLETSPTADPDLLAVKCSSQSGESYIAKKTPQYMSMGKPVEGGFLKTAMGSSSHIAATVDCDWSLRPNGAPPKICRNGVEIGESIVAYREWLYNTRGSKCDHKFIGERVASGMLTCIYCGKSQYLSDEVERG